MEKKAPKPERFESEYTKAVRVKPETLEWLRENRGKKSLAGFLEDIIKKVMEQY